MRISREEYYLGIAKAVALRSPCLRRRYSSIIVKNDAIFLQAIMDLRWVAQTAKRLDA